MTTPWIDAKGIHTFYGSSHILHGIDFTVGQGETIGLMGRNGMGKSTLLKSLMGLVKPRSGSVAVAGRDMTGKPPYEVARLGIAYVPEGRGIFGNLSVVENLQMAARAGTRGQRDWTYERVLETFPRLKERLGHGGQQLSGGEQQMLAIARALMTRPKMLLLDEPSFGIAPRVTQEIYELLHQLRETEHLTALIVEQNAQVALNLVNRAYVLESGRVTAQGTAAELREDDAVRRSYLGH